MKRHSVILTSAVAFLFVIGSIGAQSTSVRSTGSRDSGTRGSSGQVIQRGTVPSQSVSPRQPIRTNPVESKSTVSAPSTRTIETPSSVRSTGSSFATRSTSRDENTGTRVIEPPTYRDSTIGSRPVIKSSEPSSTRSYRTIEPARNVPSVRDRDGASDNSRGYTVDRPGSQSPEIAKSYRSTVTQPRTTGDTSRSFDYSTRRDNTTAQKYQPAPSVERSAPTTGYRDRNTYTESRTKAPSTSTYDRGSGSRERDSWSFSGSFSYSSDSYYRGRGSSYYFGGHYWNQSPRDRIGVEFATCYRCGYRSCRCHRAPYSYYPVRYRHYPTYHYYPTYYSYRHYPSSYVNVNLGYFGSDWFGGFSFSTGYPVTVVSEVSTVYLERVWVPGHYVYRDETVVIPDGHKEWVPPVYEEYWDGSAWVRRLISGGYWKTSPVTKVETRRVWVEGYWTTR